MIVDSLFGFHVAFERIGVGEADLAFMEELDGDEICIENVRDKKAFGDIVKFVPMKDFANSGFHALAREVSLVKTLFM